MNDDQICSPFNQTVEYYSFEFKDLNDNIVYSICIL